ncbi:MAG: ribosome biogenesis GTPase Der [Spirochaetaceae bacterium]|nr:ribosome biogenesis GTPase Der [Spirochaetaceae bacterium]
MTDSIISQPSDNKRMPIVTIIGRPNVGKSTLFNRLIGKRLAITDPTPGVTRDPIPQRCLIGNHFITLIDSGGVKQELEGLDELVTKKSLSLIAKSDIVLFMLDCMEITAEDEILIKYLRPYTDRVLLVVNKIDTPAREDLLWDYYKFGYQRVIGISAEHGNNIGELEDTLLGLLELEQLDEPEEEPETVKIAILGKPNTGKSTLTNLLVGDEVSIVSEIAGTTRDVVRGAFSFKGTDFTVLDTAGIRRKSRVGEDVEYYSVNRAIKTIDEADVVVLMIDSGIGLSDQDKKIANLIVRRGKGIVMVINKIDELEGLENEVNAIKDKIRFFFPILSFAPICAISALEGQGISAMLTTVWGVWKQLNKRIGTSNINDALKDWTESFTPPRGSLGHFKVMYGTQVSITPVRFLFFVNRIKDFPEIYEKYLKNCIRKDLGFANIPIEISLRERKRNASLNAKGDKPLLSKYGEDKDKEPVKHTPGKAHVKKKNNKPGNVASLDKRIKQVRKNAKNSKTKKR